MNCSEVKCRALFLGRSIGEMASCVNGKGGHEVGEEGHGAGKDNAIKD